MKELGCYGGWQKRFYDHLIRDDIDMKHHLDYIHYNPVKHGLMEDPFEYHYYSLNEWIKRGDYEISWGSVEPDGLKTMDLE